MGSVNGQRLRNIQRLFVVGQGDVSQNARQTSPLSQGRYGRDPSSRRIESTTNFLLYRESQRKLHIHARCDASSFTRERLTFLIHQDILNQARHEKSRRVIKTSPLSYRFAHSQIKDQHKPKKSKRTKGSLIRATRTTGT